MNHFLFAALLFATTTQIACNNTQGTPVAPVTDNPTAKAPNTPAPVVDATHNSRNSLDWEGTYKGLLPCADCKGIETTVTLNSNGTYTLDQLYIGRPSGYFKQEGTFTWSDDGGTITLNQSNSTAVGTYVVGEGRLFALLNGNTKDDGDIWKKPTLEKIDGSE